jgi:simple sugar transport system permease protein
LARFVRVSGANPFIAGLALNLAAVGAADTLSVLWYGTKGVLADPSVQALRPIRVPFLERGIDPFVLLAWSAMGLAALVIHRTKLGLRLRAAGAAGEASLERGIDPLAYREGAWAAAAALAALAGAALTFRVGAYAPGGIAGRGWIALAAVYLGFRRVWGIALAALVFALAEQAASAAQGAAIVPATLLLGLPSALALILFTLSSFFRTRSTGRSPPL